MRGWLAQPLLLSITCLLTPLPAYEQLSDSTEPAISIAEVAFSGTLQLPVTDRDQIEASLKQRTYSGSLDGVVDEAQERVRAAWQDRGYFKVQVSGNARIVTSSPVNQLIALSFRVEEGLRYRLRKIRFLNNRAISDVGTLRALFLITDGDVFSREEIAKGLENLRKAYGEIGYINFTSVPDTRFDDQERLIDLDIDEGKQFRVGSIRFPGLDETAQHEALQNFPLRPGQVYNQRVWELFLVGNNPLLDSCSIDRHLDERAGTITISLNCWQRPIE